MAVSQPIPLNSSQIPSKLDPPGNWLIPVMDPAGTLLNSTPLTNLLSGTAATQEFVTQATAAGLTISAVVYVVDGGGSAITTGIKGQVLVPFACTITAATLLADQAGSVVVDVWKTPFGSYPPTSGNSITAADQPTLSSAQAVQDTTLTGWTTTVAANDTLKFNIVSAATITRLTIILTVQRT